MSHELYLLLDSLLVADFSDLDERWELQVLSGHFLDKRLHGGGEHEESFEILFSPHHQLFLASDLSLVVRLVQMLGYRVDNRVH